MDPTTKSYVKLLLADFIKQEIHKRGVLLNDDSSEEITIKFLNDITEALVKRAVQVSELSILLTYIRMMLL